MPDYIDEEGFAYYDGERKRGSTAAQIAQAKLATAVTQVSTRTAKLEKKLFTMNAGERLDALEHAEAEAHPDRLYMYVPCQKMTSDSFDRSGTLEDRFPRECIILRQGKTVIMVDTGGAYSVTLIRNFCHAIGVDHVDYLILSHYHIDHCTGFSGIVGFTWDGDQNYPDSLDQHLDFSGCRVFLPIPCHEIDESSPLAREADSFVLAKLEELGIEPEYPKELDTLVINKDLKITFLNAGRRALNEVLALHRADSRSAMNVNDASMCCLVQHGDATIFLTGDLSKYGEERLARQYQRCRTRQLTPGTLNPLPAVGTVPDGTLVRWDADFIPASFDGVGPLFSAENVYRKIFHPDVYKVGHHAANSAGALTSDAYYAMLRPKTAFVVTASDNDGSTGVRRESNASLLECPIYSAGLDDLKFVSDGVGTSCAYGSMGWTGMSRQLLHAGRFFLLCPASLTTGLHAVWARIAFKVPAKPFSLLVHVSSASGTDAGSALLEFACTQSSDGSVPLAGARARIVSASADFTGVFGMVCEGEGLISLTAKKEAGVVWAGTILSATFLESAVLASPVYSQSYSQSEINGLAQPKWYKAAE